MGGLKGMVRPRSTAGHPIFPRFHPRPGNSPQSPVCYGQVVMRFEFEHRAASVEIVIAYDHLAARKYAKGLGDRLQWRLGTACELHLNLWNVAASVCRNVGWAGAIEARTPGGSGQIGANRTWIRTILRGFCPILSAGIEFTLFIVSQARLSALRKAMLSLRFDLPCRRRHLANSHYSARRRRGRQSLQFPPGLWVGQVNCPANQFPGGFHGLVRTSDRVARTRLSSHRALSFLNHLWVHGEAGSTVTTSRGTCQ